MLMLETKSGVLFIAGLGFFALAFLSNAVVPVLMYRDLPEQTAEQARSTATCGTSSRTSPGGSRRASRPPTARPPEDDGRSARSGSTQKCHEALRLGHKVYVGEGCWHCHSQFVRPVSNEDRRWGPVSKTEEYQNELQRPVMFGTRRVGPDLCREGGRRSNDWHAVHFFKPTTLSDRLAHARVSLAVRRRARQAQRAGLALITYVQWLGSWLESYPYYEDYRAIARARPWPRSGRTRSDESPHRHRRAARPRAAAGHARRSSSPW